MNDNLFPSLHKVYLTTYTEAGQRWLTYKGFAGDNFFIQINEHNMDSINIDPSFPVINYHSKITNHLLDKGKILHQNIYNHPHYINKSGSKKEFHKLLLDHPNIPKTVFSENDIFKLKFPVIAKPASGHSGIGISVIDRDDVPNLDFKKYDVFSEFVDKKEEHRFMLFRGKPFFWMQRTPKNDKAKTGKGSAKDQMEFGYKLRNPLGIPARLLTLLSEMAYIFKDLPYICFDVMIDKDDKPWIIESNTQPGVPFNSTVLLYQHIFEDFYKKPIDYISRHKLAELSQKMINLTLAKDPERFSVES